MKWLALLCIGLLSLPCRIVFAMSDIKPVLILNQIKALQTQEKNGDELYFDISVYRPQGPAQYLRVPKKPMHFGSQQTASIKPMVLWSDVIKPGHTLTLIVSLVEADDSPVNPDDVLGSIRVMLKNEDGVLKTQWSMPNRSIDLNQKSNESGVKQFDLQSSGTNYLVGVSVNGGSSPQMVN